MKIVKQKEKDAMKSLAYRGYMNVHQVPKLQKIVVSSGIGSGMKKDKDRGTLVADRISKITGQKPTLRTAKQSVASFKIRRGDPVGLSVTLRGEKMYHFFDKFIHIALPRTKDFRGIDKRVVDDIGNMTIGVKEHTIFPEAADEDLRDVFGLSVTLVTSAKTKEEATEYFEYLGIPFKK
jgi:large subunit ribosomal protein L5